MPLSSASGGNDVNQKSGQSAKRRGPAALRMNAKTALAYRLQQVCYAEKNIVQSAKIMGMSHRSAKNYLTGERTPDAEVLRFFRLTLPYSMIYYR